MIKWEKKWEIEKLMEQIEIWENCQMDKVNLKNVCDEDSNSITRYDKLRIDNA